MEPNIISTLQAMADTHEQPLAVIDRDYRVIAANTAYCDATSIGPAKVVGRYCFEIFRGYPSPCWQNGEECPHRNVFLHRSPCERVQTHLDAAGRRERVRITGYPIPLPDGSLLLGEAICGRSPVTPQSSDARLIGQAPSFISAIEQLDSAAGSEASLVLYGESGVGKELAAHHVHSQSLRRNGPFVVVDCASLSETLFESEMFGHERGAFTGSVGRKQGLFELAHRGTLFLDEVGELSMPMQAKLLRVLETGQFRRLGGRELLRADVRVIAATNRTLPLLVRQGAFREDLFYRLACITVQLPPLRARRSDIPALAEALLLRINEQARTQCQLSEEARECLMKHDFPGNIRELRNVMHRAVSLCKATKASRILACHISFDPAIPSGLPSGARTGMAAFPGLLSNSSVEANQLVELLSRFDGHRRQVARAMGVSERTLYRRLRRYRLNQNETAG